VSPRARSEARGDTSAYRGVHATGDRPGWRAQIGIGEGTYFLRRYSDEEQAARALGLTIRQYRPSGPTNFESDGAKGEEAKTVAEIRRWARRLHAEEGLEGFSPTSEFRSVPDRSVTARTSAVGTSAIRCTGSNEALGAWQLPS
jgi:hypothetical protein